MRIILFLFGLLGLGLILTNDGLAQGITPRDNEELKLMARRKIERSLNDFLNTLTFEDLTESERKEIVAKSYKLPNGGVTLFYDENVIIEDDLQPGRPTDQASDLKVEKYLANLDLLYSKSTEKTIDFSNIVVSNAKERNYVYVKVYYTQLFKGKNTQSDIPYRPVSRVAEVRADRVGKKWIGKIAQIGFLAPGDSATSKLNDAVLVEPPAPVDSVAIRAKQEQDELVAAQREAESVKEKKERANYEEYITKGQKALDEKNYQLALETFQEAEKRNKSFELDDTQASLKIAQTRRIINAAKIAEVELLREYREKGEIARKKRNYSEALMLYHKVLDKRPDSTALQAVIKELTQKANIKSEYDEKFAAGQYEKLVDEYDRVIKNDNSNSDWYLGRAKCYIKLNKDDRAMRDLTKSLELDYANLEALQARSDLNKRKGDLPKAIADLTAYLSIDPTNDNLFAQRAKLRIGTNNLTSADNDFSQAILISEQKKSLPQLAAYCFDRGMLRYRTHLADGEFEAAIADFTKAITLMPEKPETYFWRGLIYALKKQYPETGTDFSAATKRKISADYKARIDSVSYSLYSLGQKANEAKDYPLAIGYLTDALYVNKEMPGTLYERGLAHLKQNEYAEAIDDLTASINLAPNEGPTYDSRAIAYMAQGKFDKAIVDYRQSTKLNPANYPALLGEATALIELKKFSEAIPPLTTIKTAQKKIEKNYTPTFFRDAFYRLGRSEYATEQYEKAVDDYATAIKLDETFAEGYMERGAAYEALAKFDRAVDDYQRAIDRNPKAPGRYFAKAIALEKKRDYAQAIDAYNNVTVVDTARQFYDRTLLRRGTSYLLNDQYTEALGDLNQSTLQNNQTVCSYECWLNTGLAHLYAGQPDQSLPYLSKCLKKAPFSARAAYATACASLQKNNDADALTWFEKAFQENTLTANDIRKDKLIDVSRKDFRKSKPFKQITDKYLK